jgi:hypothetical protein
MRLLAPLAMLAADLSSSRSKNGMGNIGQYGYTGGINTLCLSLCQCCVSACVLLPPYPPTE